ncbi:hypothetical protein KFU94_30775 [Chloroflexi bacterium TSY]|nr:hypothetical protein [Chloroflexi bacterium TSY]
MALYFDAVLHLHRCDVEYVQKQEEQIRKLAVENELLFWVDYSESFRAWTLAKQGAIHQGIEEFYEPMMIGLTHLDDAGSGLTWTGGLLCEMLFKAGRIEEASNLIGILIDHAEKISRLVGTRTSSASGGFRLPKDEVGAETGFFGPSRLLASKAQNPGNCARRRVWPNFIKIRARSNTLRTYWLQFINGSLKALRRTICKRQKNCLKS